MKVRNEQDILAVLRRRVYKTVGGKQLVEGLAGKCRERKIAEIRNTEHPHPHHHLCQSCERHDVQQGSRSTVVQTQFKPPGPAPAEAIWPLSLGVRREAGRWLSSLQRLPKESERRQFVGSSSRARRPPHTQRPRKGRTACRRLQTQLGTTHGSRIEDPCLWSPPVPSLVHGTQSSPRSLGNPLGRNTCARLRLGFPVSRVCPDYFHPYR
jgi:hypothetical protein